ncbi:MAG: Fic family protein [Candidatus Methanoplasma sp.]|jgi:Fic family protein|nr:Fic family protein [Candidatus Methanoplasma sp.]
MKTPRNPPVKQFTDFLERDLERGLILASEFNKKYLHWSEVRNRETEGIDPDAIWSLMVDIRKGIREEIDIGGISIRYSMINEFQKAIHEIDVGSAAGFLSRDGIDPKDAKRYSVSSLMEESIASSIMEGAATTRKIAKIMLREGRKPKDKSEMMIVNNYKGMQFIKENKDEDLSPEFILTLHGIMTHGTLHDRKDEGALRDTDDIVVQNVLTGEISHTPPAHEDLPKLVDALCVYVNDDATFTHPLIKGVIIHFLVAYLHPFVDGNGRTARSLFYWYMLRKGYSIFEYLAVSRVIGNHRGKYDDAYVLSETDDNDITYFIRYNIKIVEESLSEFLKYLDKKINEQKKVEKEISEQQCLNIRQQMILKDALSGNPFGIASIQSKYQVSYPTARADVIKLEDLGFIVKHGVAGNKIMYVRSEPKQPPKVKGEIIIG